MLIAQREVLLKKRLALDETLKRLEYKISLYRQKPEAELQKGRAKTKSC